MDDSLRRDHVEGKRVAAGTGLRQSASVRICPRPSAHCNWRGSRPGAAGACHKRRKRPLRRVFHRPPSPIATVLPSPLVVVAVFSNPRAPDRTHRACFRIATSIPSTLWCLRSLPPRSRRGAARWSAIHHVDPVEEEVDARLQAVATWSARRHQRRSTG